MESKVIELLIEFGAHILLLTVVLWIMIKLQGFNYNFPGLLGTAVLGGGLDMIPYAGHALAVPALYLCIWKMTRASVFPDCAFTVAVGYALMFAFNVLALTALMGDLRPDLEAAPIDSGNPPLILNGTNTVKTNAVPAKPDSAPVAAAKAFLKNCTISGITHNGDKSQVLLQCRNKNFSLYIHELNLIPTDKGIVRVKLSDMDDKTYTLEIDGTPIKQPLP